MATTISNGSDTYTPTQVDGYSATRASRNVLHPIIGSNANAVALRPAGLRTGQLKLLIGEEAGGEATAANILAFLSDGNEFTLASTERPTINMQFVLDGDATLELDDTTRKNWWITFDWQETD